LNIKITGVVKYGGSWKRPNDEILGVDDEVGKDMIEKGIAVVLPKSQAEIDAEQAEATRLAEAKELADKEEADRLAEETKKDAKKTKAEPKE